MSHWSKDAIVDRVESELAEMETLEVFSYIIKKWLLVPVEEKVLAHALFLVPPQILQ